MVNEETLYQKKHLNNSVTNSAQLSNMQHLLALGLNLEQKFDYCDY